jgi:hypothetical protein
MLIQESPTASNTPFVAHCGFPSIVSAQPSLSHWLSELYANVLVSGGRMLICISTSAGLHRPRKHRQVSSNSRHRNLRPEYRRRHMPVGFRFAGSVLLKASW